MHRAEKEITSRSVIDSIIRRATVCRLALSDNGSPYIVPVCFGYEGDELFFHSAPEGHKLEILKRNDRVCFEMDIETRLIVGDIACNWGMKYLSVVGFGRASFVEELPGKREALNAIMRQYSGPTQYYDEATLKKTVVVRIRIESLTGKKSGF